MRFALPLVLAPTLAVTGFLLPSLPQTRTVTRSSSFLRMALPSLNEEKPASFYPFETSLGMKGKGKKDNSEVGSNTARQLLGMKGAAETDDLLKIRIQLMKPVTWIPLIWGVLLAGPLLTGFTQTINDWYDKDIDAINEPYRPIPSGRISEGQVKGQIWGLLLAGLGLAGVLDLWAGHTEPTILGLSALGSFISYIYSAPPLKLKQSGWIGNYALGCSYISLPWWCGQAMFGTLNAQVVVLTILYSLAGLGIAIVNDFKSIEGDRAMGLNSLPVAFGIDTAKWICVGTIDVTQLGVAGYLAYIGETTYALALLGLILPQIFFQFKYFLKDPIKYDVKYQASAQPFLVLGILTTALAVGHHDFSGI
ncbi:chlorophyll synthase [Nannochloropsis oceanica]